MTFSKDQIVSEEAAGLIDQGGRKMVALYCMYILYCAPSLENTRKADNSFELPLFIIR